MLRAHEFDKVEILAVATPEQAPALLEEMIGRAESLLVALELPYRIIEICTGDMGQSHHRSFDIEVYAPGTETWLEVSSVSWFSDYQARRADIRYRPAGEKGTQIAHTLNGSALAVPRVWAAIVENYRQPDGSVTIPAVLRPYMRGAHRHHPLIADGPRRQARSSTRRPASTSPMSPATRSSSGRRGTTRRRRPGVVEPHAMTVATVDANGGPDSRGSCSSAASTSTGSRSSPTTSRPKSRQLDDASAGGDRVHLAAAPPPGAGPRHGRAGRRRRSPTRTSPPGRGEPDRGVGVAAVAGAAGSGGARRAVAAVEPSASPAATSLGRRTGVGGCSAGRARVLAGSPEPSARPCSLPPRGTVGWVIERFAP